MAGPLCVVEHFDTIDMICLLAAAASLVQVASPPRKAVTDVIHRTISLHPLAVQIIDTPEFQRLRGVSQLAACKWIFPCAVHDRFQHSLGVAHLAHQWATRLRRLQPALAITDSDILCVTLAGLCHDLGHGPLSHLWEGQFLAAAETKHKPPEHEELSCAILDRLLEQNGIDVSRWLEPSDLAFVKALIRGGPDACEDGDQRASMRLGEPGVIGSDKGFLYDIVANKRCGFDVDKLDYFGAWRTSSAALLPCCPAALLPCCLAIWLNSPCTPTDQQPPSCLHTTAYRSPSSGSCSPPERDCYFAGTVKVSFDRERLMAQARVSLVPEDEDGSAVSGGPISVGSLRIGWPIKCVFEVLQVFITRFSLHYELYQHRVVAAIGLMLRDALLHADRSETFRVYGGRDGTVPLRLSECGGSRDANLEGYLQLDDAILATIAAEARRQRAVTSSQVDEELQAASELLARIDRREVYRFAGSVTLDAGAVIPPIDEITRDLVEMSSGQLSKAVLRVDQRRVHCGQGPDNPLERIRFFDNKAAVASDATESESWLLVPEARQHPSASYAARLPRAFEERSVRVFVTDDSALAMAEEVFADWCESRSLCNVDGTCFFGGSVVVRGRGE